MALLNDKDREYLINEFRTLTESVKLIVFVTAQGCDFCKETRQIAEELATLSDKISVDVFDRDADADKVALYGVDKTPAMVIMLGGDAPKDFGIRYYGIPSGYEFSSVVQDVLMIGRGASILSDEAKAWAQGLTQPVHMQVFVTPTCPYCPRAVVMAHAFALESEHIRADMVEATEFPDLADRYHVMGVPRTVINEDTFIEGAVPEKMLLDKIQAALN